MAVVELQRFAVSGINGTCLVVLDYDDVVQDIGLTVTGTGQPQLIRTKAGAKQATAQSLVPFIGAGRQQLLKNVAPTAVLPLDPDGVPTKMDCSFAWTP